MSQTYGPYSPVRQAGNYYFISGQVGVDPESKTASDDVSKQTSQALSNMAGVLEGAGLSMNDVMKTTIFVTDIRQFKNVNEVYEQFFSAPRPARSTIEVAALPNVANVPLSVEIEAVAYKERS